MQSTERFSNRAEHYARCRPGYPEAVVETLAAEAGLRPGAAIVDIGAGTGISSELFLRHGYSVTAVEPNAAMRAKAVERLGANPQFRAMSGTAEETGLPSQSADCVLCAQAFHWFRAEEAKREFRRLLKPRGVIAVMWNLRNSNFSPFMAGLEALLMRYCPDYADRVHQETRQAIAGVRALGDAVNAREFSWVDPLDHETLMGRLLSASYVPLEGHPNHAPLLADLNVLFAEQARDGRIDMVYDTKLYWTL